MGRLCSWVLALALALRCLPGFAAPPPNDNFADATLIDGESGSVDGSMVDSTIEVGEPSDTITVCEPKGSVWYAWTATTSRVIEFSAPISKTSPTGSPVLVYTGSAVNSLTLVTKTPKVRGNLENRSAAFRAVVGTNYHVAVLPYGSCTYPWPDFTLEWAPASGPDNDLFEDARRIEGLSGEVEASFAGATSDGEPFSVAQNGFSLWYRWIALDSRCMVFETWRRSDMCPTIAIFTGSTASTAQLVAAAEGGGHWGSLCNDSRVAFHATAGTEYRIMLDGRNVSADSRAMLSWTFAGSGPANDNFVNATPITGPSGSISGSNIGATQECGEPPGTGPSVWFSWIAPSTGRFAVTTDGSYQFDSMLAVYTGDQVDVLTLIGVNDDNLDDFTCCGGRPAKVVFDALEGTRYRLAVNGFVEGQGPFCLNWAPRPANDDFANAKEITGSSGSVMANNLAATHEEGEPLHTGVLGILSPHRSIWYRWQAPSSDRVTFVPRGSDDIADVFVYTGASVDALTPVPRTYPIAGLMIGYEFNATAETTYDIVVDGVSTGTVVLTWITGAPANDDIGNAQPIVGPSGTVAGNTLGASVGPDEPNPPSGPPLAHTIWYRWDAPASGTATLDSFGTTFNGVLVVYAGETPVSLSYVTGSWWTGYAPPDAATFITQAGHRYYVQLYGANFNEVGPTTLNWSLQVFTPTPTSTITATPTPTEIVIVTETPTPTATHTPTRDSNASSVQEWVLYP